jgi:hypothetical protein
MEEREPGRKASSYDRLLEGYHEPWRASHATYGPSAGLATFYFCYINATETCSWVTADHTGLQEHHWTSLYPEHFYDYAMIRQWRRWRTPSSGMWRRVVLVWTDVSEERIASIFRVEKSASEEQEWEGSYTEDGGDTFLQNVCSHKDYTTPHPRRRHSS